MTINWPCKLVTPLPFLRRTHAGQQSDAAQNQQRRYDVDRVIDAPGARAHDPDSHGLTISLVMPMLLMSAMPAAA
jgi:hypothetical protein